MSDISSEIQHAWTNWIFIFIFYFFGLIGFRKWFQSKYQTSFPAPSIVASWPRNYLDLSLAVAEGKMVKPQRAVLTGSPRSPTTVGGWTDNVRTSKGYTRGPQTRVNSELREVRIP